jgi:hypothetical protein
VTFRGVTSEASEPDTERAARTSRGRALTLGRLVLVVSLATLAGTACGGSDSVSKGEYEAKMRPIVIALARQLDAMHATIGGRTRIEDVEHGIRLGRRALADAARRLEAIEAPEDVERMHEGMESAARQYARELEPLLEAARCRDEDALELAEARRSSAAFAAMRDALLAMRSRAYRIPTLSLSGRGAASRRPAPRRPVPSDCAKRT